MKLIISFLLFLYIPSVFAFIAPQTSGVSTQVICAIAMQAGMTGTPRNKEPDIEDLHDKLDSTKERIKDLKRRIGSYKTDLSKALLGEISCNDNISVNIKGGTREGSVDIVKDISGYVESEGTSIPLKQHNECKFGETQANNNTYFNILKLPFALVMPANANANEPQVTFSQDKPKKCFCCVNGNVRTDRECSVGDFKNKECESDKVTPESLKEKYLDTEKNVCAAEEPEANRTLNVHDCKDKGMVKDGDGCVACPGDKVVNDEGTDCVAKPSEPDPKPEPEKCNTEKCADHLYAEYFVEEDGDINDEICSVIALRTKQRDCERYLGFLIKDIKERNELRIEKEDLERLIEDKERQLKDCEYYSDREECGESRTEAGSFCTECFNEVIQAAYPKKSGMEQFMNFLLPSAALYLGYTGIKDNNEFLSLAGFEPDNSAYTRLAYPFAMAGIYGLGRGNNPCAPGGGMGSTALGLGSLLGGLYGGLHGGVNLGIPGIGGAGIYGGLGLPGYGGGIGLPGIGGGLGIGGLPGIGGGLGIGGLPGIGGGLGIGGLPGIGGSIGIGGLPGIGGGIGLPGIGGGIGIGGLPGIGGGASGIYGQNYSLQLEAWQTAQTAYMEQMQLQQQRYMDKYNSANNITQQIQEKYNQLIRILGY